MTPQNILVVDDEHSICLLLRDALTRLGHTVTVCQDGAAAIALAADSPLDLAFLDIRMPGMGGLEVLRRLRELKPRAVFVMITGYAADDVMEESLRSGASACLCKPFSLSQVTSLLQQLAAGQLAPA